MTERLNLRLCVTVLIGALAGGLFGNEGNAHHSQAAYFDFEEEIEIEGVVSRFDFRNPHAYLYVDVVQENGETATWRVQFGNATGLRRRGWQPDMVDPGTRVTVRGNPAREEGEHAMAGADVILPDGTELGSNPRE